MQKKKTPSKKVAKKVSSKNKTLAVGDMVPNFSLASTAGETVALSALRGTRVVLYFYPKDQTSGCTIEAHEFSAVAKKFTKQGTLLFGISPDSIESHEKFIAKDGITYPLLADVGHKVADAYGVWVEKSLYGRKYMGVERSTFVIGADGKLEQVYHKVKPEGHAVCVLEDIAK